MTPHKIHAKIGAHEFNGEGNEATIREDYQMWLQALPSSSQSKRSSDQQHNDDEFEDNRNMSEIDNELLTKVFRVDGETVSLRVLPTTDNKEAREEYAAVLILYGNHVLRNKHEVSALDLIEGLRESGLTLDRVDRIIVRCSAWVRRGGKKKGTRYSLNNLGRTTAEEFLQEML